MTVTVALTESNLNDNTPVFGAGSYSFTYAENQTAGAVLGTVSASDADLADTVSYSITRRRPERLVPDRQRGRDQPDGGGRRRAGQRLRGAGQHAQPDGAGVRRDSNTSTVTVALTESNLNDNTPVFGAGSYSFTYAENQTAGAVLGTVAASDLDVSDTVSYSITRRRPERLVPDRQCRARSA